LPERLTARVVGYVQGVGFRVFVAREARRLGLTGAVWNNADGSVGVIAEGEGRVLDSLATALRRGPSEAEVERCEFHRTTAVGDHDDFRIA
jgi:acylphosphatase